MNVRDLIAFLAKQDQEIPVFLAVDEELNDFKAIATVANVDGSDDVQSASGAPVEGVVIVPQG